MRICVFEDGGVANLEPLSLTRPAFDLRCGAEALLGRHRRFFAAQEVGALVRPGLATLCGQEHPDLAVNDLTWLGAPRRPEAGRGPEVVALVNARWLAAMDALMGPNARGVGLVGGEVAYAVVPAAEAAGLSLDDLPGKLADWKESLPQRPAGGRMIDYPWDLIESNAEALEEDYRLWVGRRERRRAPEGVTVMGPAERLIVDPSARVEPLVAIDTTRGPVLIDRGAVVQTFSRISGPCYVGPGTHVLGARVRGGSLGPQCRIGGEVESSIVHGHTNKAHDGFLGHSYLGEWVNLGAGTQGSDLRNDYAPVSMRVRGERVETGLLKVGAFIGDHAKAGLGTLLNTGSLVGPFAQLLPSGLLLPRFLPAFSQFSRGRVQERTDLRQMFATAATMMARRGVEWTEPHAELFFELYEQTDAERRHLIHEVERRRLRQIG